MSSDNNHNKLNTMKYTGITFHTHTHTHTKVFVCSDAIILRISIFILNNLMFNKFLTVSRMRNY